MALELFHPLSFNSTDILTDNQILCFSFDGVYVMEINTKQLKNSLRKVMGPNDNSCSKSNTHRVRYLVGDVSLQLNKTKPFISTFKEKVEKTLISPSLLHMQPQGPESGKGSSFSHQNSVS